MKRNRNRPNPTSVAAKATKARWLPNDTTRPQTFADRRKVANKRACRGKVTFD